MLAVPSRVQGSSADQVPRWVRLTRTAADTTGVAEVGLYGSTIIEGHWWRLSADSIEVSARDLFDAVWLRFEERGDSASGTVKIYNDGNMTPRQLPLEPWIGVRGTCPRH